VSSVAPDHRAGDRSVPNGLMATTRRIDHPVDLLEAAGAEGLIWQHGGVGFAGRSVALRIPVDDPVAAQRALSAIASDDEVGRPGCGPLAFGALPFDRAATGELAVPAELWGVDADGTRWHTTVAPIDGQDCSTPNPRASPGRTRTDSGPVTVDAAAHPAPPTGPTSFTVTSTRSPGDWCAAVAAGRDAVLAGRLRKLVLAREVVVRADVALDAAILLRRLRAAYPEAHLFSVEGFVGASPELLVARHDDVVRAYPMAGTVARSGDPTTDARRAAELLSSAKDRQEHQITIDMVHETLLPWCSYLDYEAEPSVVPMANVAHLATRVEGRLSQPAPSVLELVAALHPTPAVGGWPRDTALALIAELEQLDRGRYAGPVGWVDGRGNGAWAVGIRSAELDGPTARLMAGVGVVADSDPDAELAETRAKLQALLSAIIRP